MPPGDGGFVSGIGEGGGVAATKVVTPLAWVAAAARDAVFVAKLAVGLVFVAVPPVVTVVTSPTPCVVSVALIGGFAAPIDVGWGPSGVVPGDVVGTASVDELRMLASEEAVARFRLVSFGEVAAGNEVLDVVDNWFVVAVGMVVVVAAGTVDVVAAGNVFVVAVVMPGLVTVGRPLLSVFVVGMPVLPVVEVDTPDVVPVVPLEPVAPVPAVCAASRAAELTRPARKREALVFIGP